MSIADASSNSQYLDVVDCATLSVPVDHLWYGLVDPCDELPIFINETSDELLLLYLVLMLCLGAGAI